MAPGSGKALLFFIFKGRKILAGLGYGIPVKGLVYANTGMLGVY